MKWWQYLVCFALIIASIFAGISLWQTYTAESQVIGYVTHKKVETVDVINISIDNLVFYETDTPNVYVFEDELAKKDFDGTKNNYEIKLNNNPCTVNNYRAGFITSTSILYFYDLDGTLGADVELIISFEFYSTKTLFTITAKSSLTGMSKLNQLIESEGINIVLSYSEYSPVTDLIKKQQQWHIKNVNLSSDQLNYEDGLAEQAIVSFSDSNLNLKKDVPTIFIIEYTVVEKYSFNDWEMHTNETIELYNFDKFTISDEEQFINYSFEIDWSSGEISIRYWNYVGYSWSNPFDFLSYSFDNFKIKSIKQFY